MFKSALDRARKLKDEVLEGSEEFTAKHKALLREQAEDLKNELQGVAEKISQTKDQITDEVNEEVTASLNKKMIAALEKQGYSVTKLLD